MLSSLRLFRRLHAVLAGCSQSELRAQIEFLKAEITVLRSHLPGGQIRTTSSERRLLVRLGLAVGPAIRELLTIVSPATFRRWVMKGRSEPSRATRGARGRSGRPRTAAQIRSLVIRLARETPFGYTKILGELWKLGIRGVSRTTIRTILREAGIPPAPDRRQRTWADFLKAHADSLWACDLMSTRIVTMRGVRLAFSIVFLHIASRRLYISPCTHRPTRNWVAQETSAWLEILRAAGERPELVIRDNDSKFGPVFEVVLEEAGAESMALPIQSPNLNAHVERVIQTIRRECLDEFIVLGRLHMDHLLGEYAMHYNRERPHSALRDHQPPCEAPRSGPHDLQAPVIHRTRLGGILHHYERLDHRNRSAA